VLLLSSVQIQIFTYFWCFCMYIMLLNLCLVRNVFESAIKNIVQQLGLLRLALKILKHFCKKGQVSIFWSAIFLKCGTTMVDKAHCCLLDATQLLLSATECTSAVQKSSICSIYWQIKTTDTLHISRNKQANQYFTTPFPVIPQHDAVNQYT